MAVLKEFTAKWVFGTVLTGEPTPVNTGSTGTGARASLDGIVRETIIYIETGAGCTASYQVLTSRTSTGASQILSSGTLAAADVDVVHITGPYAFLYPRVKTMTSTAVSVIVEAFGN